MQAERASPTVRSCGPLRLTGTGIVDLSLILRYRSEDKPARNGASWRPEQHLMGW
jgi:hypothetical protein